MTSRALPGRRTRVVAALMSALGVLIALGGLTAAATVSAASGTRVQVEDAPFSFD